MCTSSGPVDCCEYCQVVRRDRFDSPFPGYIEESKERIAAMVDEMVLQAQKWVNATYKSVAGYNAVTEDGKTGWNTMYSLTRALQHELGIAVLSNAFGPTTLSTLAARGDIKVGESNKNIVKIIQCGLWCK